mgnify:CR=1 FL=1
MKKVTLLFVACYFFFNSAFGQKPKAQIETISGVKTINLEEISEARFEGNPGYYVLKFFKIDATFESFPVDEIKKITFSPYGMTNFPLVVNYTSGTPDSIPLNDIEYLEFGNKTTVDDNPPLPQFLCYPNPVVSGQAFFAFPEGNLYEIDIFDAEGIQINKIVPSNGGDTAKWDCKDFSGNDVAPGIYFCRAFYYGHYINYKVIIIR